MKNRIIALLAAMLFFASASAQSVLNNVADNIVGTYSGIQDGMRYRTKIVKLKDGTYRGQMVWMEKATDANGNKILDTKNPDKSLRSTPIDKIVMFYGLQYNAKKKQWDGAKIYDPQRGIRANLTICFEKDGRLRVKGSLLGISESVFWKRE